MKRLIILLSFIFCFGICKSQRIICNPMAPDDECAYAYVALKEFIDDSSLVVMLNTIAPLKESFNGITWQYNDKFYKKP